MKALIQIVLCLLVETSLYAQTTTVKLEILKAAFDADSVSFLDQFVQDWMNKTPMIQPSELQRLDDTLRSLYSLYFDFMHAHREELDSSLNIVQNALDFRLVTSFEDSDEPNGPFSRVHDFRPRLPHPANYIVYIDTEYATILSHFLLQENGQVPPLLRDEAKTRHQFLSHRLVLPEGHWGNYWLLSTAPSISLVQIDRRLTSAIIHYNDGDYSWWVAKVKKTRRGKWIIDQERLIGIQ